MSSVGRLPVLVAATLAASALTLPAVAADAPQPREVAAETVLAGKSTPLSDRVIVEWRAGATRSARVAARAAVNTKSARDLGSPQFQVLTLARGQSPAAAVKELSAQPGVRAASRDGYSTLDSATAPNDPMFNQLWGLLNTGSGVQDNPATAAADIAAPFAWDRTPGSEGVKVAVLDTGIRFTHPDLADRVWTNPDEIPGNSIDDDTNGVIDDVHGADFVGPSGDAPTTDGDPTDDQVSGGHGVHTAGTVAAEGDNGIGITGVAQKAALLPIRICSWGPVAGGVVCPFSSQIAAINYAGEQGARVANMSLGGTTANVLVRDALAENPDTLFVISAGNDGTDNDSIPRYPCNWDPGTSGIPGAVDNVVCVAATDQRDKVAGFSDYGAASVDIAAPGTQILSTYSHNTLLDESFGAAGFPYAGWTNSGYVRTNASPLLSNGVTNNTATQAPGTTRTLRTPAVTVDGGATCTSIQWRKLTSTPAGGDAYSYTFVVNGLDQPPIASTTQAAGVYLATFTVPGSGPQNVAIRYDYTRGAATPGSNGVWLDDLDLTCYAAPGQEGSRSYAFLDGTSMAAPHVAGVGTLMNAYEPKADTTEVRQAMLDSAQPLADLDPASGGHPVSSGGRLDADAALAEIDALVPPSTQILSGPAGTSGASATFTFGVTDTQAPATFDCKVDGGPFTACSSPHTLNGLTDGSHTLVVRAKDTPGNVDPAPPSATWTAVVPAPAPKPTVTPTPSPTVAPPAKVTGITVKRSANRRTAKVAWKAAAGATSYEVRRGIKGRKLGPPVTVTAGRTKLKGLKPAKKYVVQIVAVNAGGKSAGTRKLIK